MELDVQLTAVPRLNPSNGNGYSFDFLLLSKLPLNPMTANSIAFETLRSAEFKVVTIPSLAEASLSASTVSKEDSVTADYLTPTATPPGASNDVKSSATTPPSKQSEAEILLPGYFAATNSLHESPNDSKSSSTLTPTSITASKPAPAPTPSCPHKMPALTVLPKDCPFEIRPTPNKGHGVFAIAPIKKGTMLLAEEPLIRIYRQHYLTYHIERAFDKIPAAKKPIYWSLASAHGQDASRSADNLLRSTFRLSLLTFLENRYPKAIYSHISGKEQQRIQEQHDARTAGEPSLLSIFMTNAMECENGAAVFEIAARFNHACIPNAHFAWSGAMGKETVFAVKDLDAGDEITLSYCDPYYDISMRKWELNHYGFECKCPACTDTNIPNSFAEKSKERRWRLREIDDDLVNGWIPGGDIEKNLEVQLEIVALMREEGLVTPNLAGSYHRIARLAAQKEDFAFAVRAAEKSYNVFKICLGAESEKTKEVEKSVRAFRKQVPKSNAPPKKSNSQ